MVCIGGRIEAGVSPQLRDNLVAEETNKTCRVKSVLVILPILILTNTNTTELKQ